MAKHRIVQKPSAFDPSVAIYEVEESLAFGWWHPCGVFDTLKEAKQRVVDLKNQEKNRVERRVIGVYD